MNIKRIGLGVFGLLFFICGMFAQDDVIPFDSDRWVLESAEVVEHLGRKCLAGSGYLKDLEFENGVIEVDVALSGHRSYPGLIFRLQSQSNYERIYIRPHRALLYPDAVQYTPVFNGNAGWQLYNGNGYTSGATLPPDKWIHLKLEVSGKQARFYIDDQLALNITDLKHGISKGSIGLSAPNNKSAGFSNFKYRVDNDLKFDPPPEVKTPPETITQWEVSKPLDINRISREQYPTFFQVFMAGWKPVTIEPSGLVNISKFISVGGAGPHCVFARTFIRSEKKQTVKLQFGYSDEVDIFFNRKKLYTGSNGYQERDPSSLGIIGLFDAVYLPLERGLNEIFLVVTERFGGWGFMAKADRELELPVKQYDRFTKAWETPADFKIPESVLYDPSAKILYVTSYDKLSAKDKNTGFISRVTVDGKIKDLKWVEGLDGPMGMDIYKDTLYVAESSGNLVEINRVTGKIVKKHAVPGARFLNDVTVDEMGNVYISDTFPGAGGAGEGSKIYRFTGGRFEIFRGGDEIDSANGLFIYKNSLLVGNSGDGFLKAVHLGNRGITDIVCLGAGVIDGIRVDNGGNLLVSHWEGQVYMIYPTGEVVEVLDISDQGLNTADFEFIKEENLLIIPTFMGNKVVAYKLKN